jgi:hypothetical protein
MEYACSSAQNIALRQIEDIISHFRAGDSLEAGRREVRCSVEEDIRLFAEGSEAMEAIEYLARVIYERQPRRQGDIPG